jgi:hypothetical protein
MRILNARDVASFIVTIFYAYIFIYLYRVYHSSFIVTI